MEEQIKKNHFKGYQEQKVGKRAIIIDAYLSELVKKNTKFRNVTELAEKVAVYITTLDGKPCNKSTLLRNADYKNLLNYYLYTYGGIKDTADYKKNNPVALLSAELASSNAERENVRLKQYISNIEKELDDIKNNVALQPNEVYLDKETMDFSLVCKALAQLIQHFEGLVAVDSKTGSLVDLSKKRDNVIVDKSVMLPFLQWYSE